MLKVSTIEDLENITLEITELYFTDDFNEPLENIPFHIKKIEFHESSKFNYALDFLTENLEELIMNSYKNHTLDEIRNFPKSLKVLRLGGEFNQEIFINILPPNLTHLIFGFKFNKKIMEDVLPKNLRYLTFGKITSSIKLDFSL